MKDKKEKEQEEKQNYHEAIIEEFKRIPLEPTPKKKKSIKHWWANFRPY
jgi:hypothetical protein